MATFSNGVIHGGYYVSGDGFPNSFDPNNLYLADLRYTIGTSLPVSISPTVSGAFVNGVWTGPLTVQVPAEDLVLRANDGDGHTGKADKITVLVLNDLGVTMTALPSLADVGSDLTYSITVTKSQVTTRSKLAHTPCAELADREFTWSGRKLVKVT